MQDIILLVALGASVMIGVFASQLASETWDSVLEEVEAEKKTKLAQNSTDTEGEKANVTTEIMGWQLPQWLIGFQYALKDAENSINDLIDEEYEARVWNYTKSDPPPASLDPAKRPESPEIACANQGIDYTLGFCESLVLSPLLFQTFFRYADPFYDQTKDDGWKEREDRRKTASPDEAEVLRKQMLLKINTLKSKIDYKIAELDKHQR